VSLGNRTSRAGMVSALATTVVALFAAAAPANAAEPLTDAVRSVDAAAAAIGAGRGDSATSDFRKASGAMKASTSLGDVTVAAGTIALGGLRAKIGLPVARTAPASSVVAGDLVVADKATTFVVDALPNGVRISSVLNSGKASHTLRYELTLPDGVGPRLEADGSVSLVQRRAGSPELALASIAAPWAVDAAGHSVATRYEVDGNALIQIVTPGAGAVYPIVADPSISGCLVGGWYPAICVKYNRQETINAYRVASGAATAGALATELCSGLGQYAALCRTAVVSIFGKVSSDAIRAYAEGRCLQLRFGISPLINLLTYTEVVNC